MKKAGRPEVKAYATMLVADHTKANKERSKLAASKDVDLSGVIEPAQAETFQRSMEYYPTA